MFTGISWQSYFLTITTLAGSYYLLVLLRFHGRALLSSWPGVLAIHGNRRASLPPADAPMQAGQPEEQAAHACVDELSAFFEEAKKSSWNQEQLTASLRGILAKYAGIQHSEYRPMIEGCLISYSEHYCSIRLRKVDLVGLWQEG